MATPFSYTVPNWREGSPNAAETAIYSEMMKSPAMSGQGGLMLNELAANRHGNERAYADELSQQHAFAQQQADRHQTNETRGAYLTLLERAKDNPWTLGLTGQSDIAKGLLDGTDPNMRESFAGSTYDKQRAEILEKLAIAQNNLGQGGLAQTPQDASDLMGIPLHGVERTNVLAAAMRPTDSYSVTGGLNSNGTAITGSTKVPVGGTPNIGNLQRNVQPQGTFIPRSGAPNGFGNAIPQAPGAAQSQTPVFPPNGPNPNGAQAQPSVLDGQVSDWNGTGQAPTPSGPIAPTPAPPGTPLPAASRQPTQTQGANRPTSVPKEIVVPPGVPDSRTPDGRWNVPGIDVPGVAQARQIAKMLLPRLMAIDKYAFLDANNHGSPQVVNEGGIWKYIGQSGRTYDLPVN